MVGGEVVVVEVLGVEVVGACAGTGLEDALAPGCSFATTTPMAMVAPVATKTAEHGQQPEEGVGATPGLGGIRRRTGSHRTGSRIGIGLMEAAARSIRL